MFIDLLYPFKGELCTREMLLHFLPSGPVTTVVGRSNGPFGIKLGGKEIIARVVLPAGDAIRLDVSPGEQQVDEGVVLGAFAIGD